MSKSAKANRPVHEIRMGRIKAAIWENSTESGTRHNVTISRLYKDDRDQWRDSSSFGRDDMPLIMTVCDLVHKWIYAAAAEATNGAHAEAVETF